MTTIIETERLILRAWEKEDDLRHASMMKLFLSVSMLPISQQAGK